MTGGHQHLALNQPRTLLLSEPRCKVQPARAPRKIASKPLGEGLAGSEVREVWTLVQLPWLRLAVAKKDPGDQESSSAPSSCAIPASDAL